MKKPITEIAMNGKIYPIGIQMVKSSEIGQFLKTNPTRGELFIDENGVMYVIDKGDLEVYWRRLGGEVIEEKKEEKEEVGFLDDIVLDL